MWFVIAIILVALCLIVWATTRKSRVGHSARVALMFMSGGFVFPHAMSEGEDIAKRDADKGAEVKKQ